jgi:predicted RND superfamily exporter protein
MNPLRVRTILFTFLLLSLASIYFVFQLKFAFSLDQFFPEGDEELDFYQEFVKEFETDINFLLVAVENEESVFDSTFLSDFHEFTLACRDLPHITRSQSLTTMTYPLKTPFGITGIPVIHMDAPEKYDSDRKKIMQDSRFKNTLISEDGRSIVVAMKTAEKVGLEESKEMILGLEALVSSFDFDNYYVLGPAYLQKEMARMQEREITVSAIVSGLLVSIVMFWLFRRTWGIIVALVSIGIGMLLFVGLLGAWGRPLNAMAALYPVLMIIVGTSDVIHIMSKYIDELRKGQLKRNALRTTVREIGMATLLTSLTTAVGFASLLTSRISPIRDFGLNAAIGVVIAFLTVITFTIALLSFFHTDQLIKLGRGQAFWENTMQKAYDFTRQHTRSIIVGALGVLLLCFWGMSRISTNYTISKNLPRGEKVSSDFLYFEENYAGFRPLEIAIFSAGDYKADDFAVVQQVDKIENYLRSFPDIQSINSVATVYKSLHQMSHGNQTDWYRLPEKASTFKRYKKFAEKLPEDAGNIMISKDGKKTRITTRVLDVGSDSLKAITRQVENWIAVNTDSTIITAKATGTGLILDKNAEYIRKNLLQGLGLAILIISVLMALLFKNWRMVIISIIPNVFPLLIAGALLGFVGIELEAGTAIVFAVIFGIAVDDTIHFLSKYKLSRDKGLDMEAALRITFLETGKAICLTSVILFFGFLVMLFSINPPSVTVGLLISLTLASALIADLFTIPLLIRWLGK